MFNLFKIFFSTPSLEELSKIPGSGVVDDKDFGLIRFVEAAGEEDEGFWQMEHDWELPAYNAKIGCCEIPGDINGPFDEARSFLLSKKENIDALWKLCEGELRKNIAQWYPKDIAKNSEDIFFLSSLAMDSDSDNKGWEISFEAKDEYKWTFMSFQLEGDKIIGGTVDT